MYKKIYQGGDASKPFFCLGLIHFCPKGPSFKWAYGHLLYSSIQLIPIKRACKLRYHQIQLSIVLKFHAATKMPPAIVFKPYRPDDKIYYCLKIIRAIIMYLPSIHQQYQQFNFLLSLFISISSTYIYIIIICRSVRCRHWWCTLQTSD